MFTNSFFNLRYFAQRFFPKIGGSGNTWEEPGTATLTITPAGDAALSIIPAGTATLMATTNIYIGTDYVGTLTGVAFGEPPVAGDNTVTGVWILLDNCGCEISRGSTSYVSSGKYTFTIDYLVFNGQKPVNPTSYRLGELYVIMTAGTVDVSVGSNVKFMYPPLVNG